MTSAEFFIGGGDQNEMKSLFQFDQRETLIYRNICLILPSDSWELESQVVHAPILPYGPGSLARLHIPPKCSPVEILFSITTLLSVNMGGRL